MQLTGCESLREALRGCRAILLTATEAEARPLREALLGEKGHTVATKDLYCGEIARIGADAARSSSASPGRRAVPAVVGVSGCDKANAAHLLTCLLQAMSPPPDLVLQVGIGGGFSGGGFSGGGFPGDGLDRSSGPGESVRVGDVVVATGETYSDTGSSSPSGWLSAAELGLPIARPARVELAGVFPIELPLVEAARAAITAAERARGETEWPGDSRVLLGPCLTSSCVTGRLDDAQAASRRWGALAESMEGAAAAHISAFYRVPFLEIRGISNLVTDRDRESWQVERAIAMAGHAALAVVRALDQLPLGGE